MYTCIHCSPLLEGKGGLKDHHAANFCTQRNKTGRANKKSFLKNWPAPPQQGSAFANIDNYSQQNGKYNYSQKNGKWQNVRRSRAIHNKNTDRTAVRLGILQHVSK